MIEADWNELKRTETDGITSRCNLALYKRGTMSDSSHLISWPDYGLIATRGKRLTFINLTGEEKAKCVDMKLDVGVTPHVLGDKLFLHESYESAGAGNLYYFLADDLLQATTEMKKRYLEVRQAVRFGINSSSLWLSDPMNLFWLYSVTTDDTVITPILEMEAHALVKGEGAIEGNRAVVNGLVQKAFRLKGGIQRHEFFFTLEDDYPLLFLLQFYTDESIESDQKEFELVVDIGTASNPLTLLCHVTFQASFGYFGVESEYKPTLTAVYDFNKLGVQFISEIREVSGAILLLTEWGNYMVTTNSKVTIEQTEGSNRLGDPMKYLDEPLDAETLLDHDLKFNVLSVDECPVDTKVVKVKRDQVLPLKYLKPIVSVEAETMKEKIVAWFGIESDLSHVLKELEQAMGPVLDELDRLKQSKLTSKKKLATKEQEWKNISTAIKGIKVKMEEKGVNVLTRLFLPCNETGLLYRVTKQKLDLVVMRPEEPSGFITAAATTYGDMIAYINSNGNVMMESIADIKEGVEGNNRVYVIQGDW